MAFGHPSTPSSRNPPGRKGPPQAPGDLQQPPTPQDIRSTDGQAGTASTNSDHDARLGRPWILNHLCRLNANARIGHTQDALQSLADELSSKFREDKIYNQPVRSVFAQIAPVFALVLVDKVSRRHDTPAFAAMQQVAVAGAPLLGEFLVAINGFVLLENETQLGDFLVLEPPFNDTYHAMIEELRKVYPKDDSGAGDALEKKCTDTLTAARDGVDGFTTWSAFIRFAVQYLAYLRDVDTRPESLLQTYELLSELQRRANSALNHPTLGSLMLPIVVSCATIVCRLAIGLDKHPELVRGIFAVQLQGEDGGSRETLPERAANTLRQAFVTCLNDRTSGLKDGKPEGKKRGIYTIANICLKILFQCRKSQNATQIFENIYHLSPPLSAYSKKERVTYLYYLGRFYFSNNSFFRAQRALQHAYDESPAHQVCVKQRRLILIYLVTSCIIMGRFPARALLQRPEAEGFTERFGPVIIAIQKGDLAGFRTATSIAGPHARWFQRHGVLMQMINRCEVLVWRSLIRKTWLLAGTRPDSNTKAGPLIDLEQLTTAFTVADMEERAKMGGVRSVDERYIGGRLNPKMLPTVRAVESKLGSLISQNFLRGFIAHDKKKFVITGVKSYGGDALAAGFPPPWEVIQENNAGDDEVPGWKMGEASAHGVGSGAVITLSGARPAGL